jgi:colicin import membrane protein
VSVFHGAIIWRPLIITLLLHVLLLYVLTLNLSSQQEVSVKPRLAPRYIEARLVTAESLKPKPKPRVKPRSTPKPTAQARKPATRSAATAATKPAVSQPKPVATPKPVAKPVQPSAEDRAAAAREELSRALAAEDILLEQASDLEVTQSYVALITRVIQDNWSRPPSARNDMEAELVIQLIPTGEVVSVSVTRSSGLAAFDRSAVRAVEKAERFPELQQLPARIFNKDFRTLRLKFKPEDLRY